MSRSRRLGLLAGLIVLLAVGLVPRPVSYTPAGTAQATNVAAWAEAQISQSVEEGVRPGNEERLIWANEMHEKTPWTLLYIHGFGASRGEGEYTVEQTAQAWGMNAYLLRLPCHGFDDPDKHAACDWTEWLDRANDALTQMPLLGERTLVMGTSMGALFATWLAAEHPDAVDAMVLASPAYGFANKMAVLLHMPVGPPVQRLLYGDTRDAGWRNDIQSRKVDGYDDHWTLKQRYTPLYGLARAQRYIAKDDTFEKVKTPTLVLYYYKDEQNQDEAASVPRIREAAAIFARNNPKSRSVAIEDGAHVLFSAYVRTDKVRVQSEIDGFLSDVVGPKPPPPPPEPAAPAEIPVEPTP